MEAQPPAQRERVRVESNSQRERETKCEERERVEKSDRGERKNNSDYKIYPIVYSAILHVEWHCSKIVKKFTILGICNSRCRRFLREKNAKYTLNMTFTIPGANALIWLSFQDAF